MQEKASILIRSRKNTACVLATAVSSSKHLLTLDFAAIDVLVVVQNDSFYPSAGGDADDLEYANGFFHRLSLLSALVLG